MDAQIAGYTVYYMKEGNPQPSKFDPKIMEIPISIESKIIRPELKESFLNFIKEIGDKVPSEKEFNEWFINNSKK
jgi:hypothetical protein